MWRNFKRIFILAALVAAAPASALAHAIIVTSQPQAGAVLAGPDIAIALTYNVRIDAERSKLTLIAADGASSDIAIVATGAPEMLTGTAAGLAPGAYVLRWQVLASDGHITRGDVPFSIAP